MYGAFAATGAVPCIEVGAGSGAAHDGFEAGVTAAADALSSIRHHPLSAVIVYVSPRYDVAEVLRGVASAVGDAPVFGVTTAGEICNGRATGTVAVAAIASPHLAVHCAVGANASSDPRQAIASAVAQPQLRAFFEMSPATRQQLTREGKTVFAMLFSPGNTQRRDSRGYELLEILKAQTLGHFPIVGGSAADDWRLESNAVLLGRDVHPDGVLVVLFETKLQVGISLTHGFRSTGQTTTVTEASGQELLTLDHRPAADTLCELVGGSRDSLAGKHVTLTTGRAIGIGDAVGQFGITVCTFLTPRSGVRVPQPLAPGTVLSVMEPDPMNMGVAGTDAVRKATLRGGVTKPTLALVNYCALRARLVGDGGAQREILDMARPLGGAPLVGFCSFGEAGLADDGVSRYANAAISVVVIGTELSHAAQVALEAERLRQELERKANELEQRVATRTQELLIEKERAEEAERQLARAQAQLVDAIETMSEGFALFDAADRLVLCNTKYRKLYQISADRLVPGVPFEQALRFGLERGQYPDAVGREEAWLADRLTMHRQPQSSFEQHIANGLWLQVIERRTRDGGTVGIRIDITEHKQREQELLQAKEAAEFADRTKTEFLANMSHELRTPLNAILGFSEVIRDAMFEPISDRYRDYGRDIHGAGQHLLQLISDVLDLSKIEATRLELRPEAIEVAEAVGACHRLVRERARERGIGLEIAFPPGLPLIIVDPVRFKQIVLNLLSNAIKFSRDGGNVRIEASLPPPGGLLLSIIDRGIGMDPKDIPTALAPFRQIENSLNRRHPGTGLGLPLAKRLTELHGGRLEIKTDLEIGTTAEIHLPEARLIREKAITERE